jgi:hypothetical protein
VIASEDTHAVQEYFSRFKPRRVKFIVLPTENGLSAPQYIIGRLDEFRREFELGGDDQLWYCGDTDHWVASNHILNLKQVLQHCRQAGINVALSKPCFELWLLLHFSDKFQALQTCREICEMLSTVAGGYSKSHGCTARFTPEMVMVARERAFRLDEGSHEIPATPTTRVYQILDVLIQRESIIIS